MTVAVLILTSAALAQESGAADPLEAEFHRASAALQSGDLAAAERGFQKVLRAQPTNIGTLANLGVTYSRMERTADAIDSYRRALKLTPNEPMLMLNLGLAHLKQGEYSAAKPLFARVDQSPQASTQSRQLLATCELFTGFPEKALKLVEPLPQSPEKLFIEGTAHLRLKHADQAKAAFTDLMSTQIAPAQAHLLLGRAYSDAAQFEQAIEEFNQTLQLDASLRAARIELAKAQIGLRRNDEAAQTLRTILAADARNADANYYLGALLVLSGREQEARSFLETARAAKPDAWGAYYYLGRAFVQQKQAAQALPLLERATKLNPEEAAAWFQLSRAYQAAGRASDARAARDRYTQLREKSLEDEQQILAPAR